MRLFVEGVKFHLFGTSLSGIEVNEFAVTGKDGKAHFDDVLIGTGYTIEEIDTAVRYVVPANQTAAVEWNSVTNKSFSNVLKKFNVTVTNKDIHYFSCSNYVKDYRGTCLTRHYIRADSIATIVEMELRRLADYLVDDTERFAEILAKKSTKEWESEKKAAQGELTKAEMRIEMIPKLLKKLYEDNLSGKTSDDDYSILSQEYSVERDQLKKKILGLRDKLKGMEDRAGEREAFVKAIRKFMSMKTLTAPLLRELIDHIDVYEVEGQGKNKTQRVVIYYKFVGYLEIPNDLSRPTYSADLREGVSVEYITCEAGEDILDEEA